MKFGRRVFNRWLFIIDENVCVCTSEKKLIQIYAHGNLSIIKFKLYFISQFRQWISWELYGVYAGKISWKPTQYNLSWLEGAKQDANVFTFIVGFLPKNSIHTTNLSWKSGNKYHHLWCNAITIIIKCKFPTKTSNIFNTHSGFNVHSINLRCTFRVCSNSNCWPILPMVCSSICYYARIICTYYFDLIPLGAKIFD